METLKIARHAEEYTQKKTTCTLTCINLFQSSPFAAFKGKSNKPITVLPRVHHSNVFNTSVLDEANSGLFAWTNQVTPSYLVPTHDPLCGWHVQEVHDLRGVILHQPGLVTLQLLLSFPPLRLFLAAIVLVFQFGVSVSQQVINTATVTDPKPKHKQLPHAVY